MVEAVMSERPDACPACSGAALIRSGHGCGRQRWRCKGCRRQFTRTTPRGKPAAIKQQAVALHCTGLSLNAIGKQVGVSAQSVMRRLRRHAEQHCPKPVPAGGAAVVEIDELWHFLERRRASLGSGRPSRATRGG
jgi:transposase